MSCEQKDLAFLMCTDKILTSSKLRFSD